MLTDEQIAQLARAAEAATATEVAALAASVTALATSVGELRALVETRTAAPVAENTVVEGTPAPVESAAATEGDRAGDTDVEIVKLEGESDNDALNRHIDEVAARLRGAPIPSKK